MEKKDDATNFKLFSHGRLSWLNAALSTVLMLCIAVLPFTGHAFEGILENDIQDGLDQSRAIIITLQSKLRSGGSLAPEISHLKNTADNIRITHLLLEERFRLREEKAATLGSSALERQRAMAEGYRQALTEYLSIIDGLPSDGSIPQSAIRNLQSLLDKLVPKKKRPIIGSLPYKHLNLPAVEPTAASAITPAYKGGNKTVSLDDTAATAEAPISKEIAALAQSLGWSPVTIYEYVKNNVETEWYWGCMKGAEDTLHQKSGNDCDQAALLVALLRASGYPTRYVRGVIEFFPDIERAKHLLGIDDPAKIAEFFQKAGIPNKPIIAGGKIANFQIEHIWVETQVPYSNYRGSIIDEHGKAWIGLDTSIKVKGYEYNQAKDLYQEPGISSLLSGIRNEYLGFTTSPTNSTSLELNQTPLEYLQSRINSELTTQNSQLAYNDFLHSRTLLPENLKILPASLQFGQVKVTHEYTTIPDELIHKVKFTAADTKGTELFSVILPTYKLSNRQLALGYEPETVQDQEIIDSYGGLDNTPAYLVRLRPVLKLNGERIVVAADGLPMGTDYDLSIELIAPNATEKINNTLIAGNLTVIGITSQKAILTPSLLAGEGGGEGPKDAERLLYESAQHYIDRWNKAEEEFASLLNLNLAHPIPAVVTVGGVIDVSYLLDMPHGFTWKGVYVDADLRRVETVRSAEFGVGSESEGEKIFMQLSSLQGSVLEHKLFEDDFQAESISTAKLLQLQHGMNVLTIDKTNIETVLPTLDLADNIKEDLRNSVNQNFSIRIPQSPLTYHDWSGIGYIKENTETGESGWMLSGMIAGGMTAVKKELWIDQDKAAILQLPNTLPPNLNSGSAVRLVRVSDYVTGFAGSELKIPCQTRAVDAAGRPVVNVPVTFRVIEGGGKVQGVDMLGNILPNLMDNSTVPAQVYSVVTGTDGIARVKVTLGERTDASPYYRELMTGNKKYWELVGLNMVTMSAQNGSGTFTTEKPFEAYGRAGKAAKFEVVSPKSMVYGFPNTLATTAWIKVVDQYGNSISGKNVNFSVERTFLGPDPGPDAKTARLYAAETDCPNIAILDCPKAKEYTSQEPLAQVSEHYGAMAYVIIGNSSNTLFTIKASAKKDTFDTSGKRIDTTVPITPAAAMAYQTYPKTDPNANAEFSLMALAIYRYDEQGHWIDAGLVNQTFPEKLAVQMFYHEESYEAVPNDSGVFYLKGTGVFTTRKVTDGEVKFEPIPGSGGLVSVPVSTANPDGLYTTDLKLAPDPKLNIVEASGSAPVLRPTVDPVSGAVSKPVVTLRASTFFNIWGVKPAVQPSQLIMINSDGYPVTDTEIKFSILPAAYQYSTKSLYLDFYEKNTLGNESWMGFVQADPTGKIILTRGGVKFNPAYTYSVQLIVDRGRKKEVMSQKTALSVAQLNVVTDEGMSSVKVDEFKFGDGSRNNKRYRIELKTGSAECAALTPLSGTISTILKSGQTATPAGADYYPAQHDLTFNPAISGCSVKVNNKLKFVVSNLSKTDLQNRNSLPSDTEVVYGGIGGRERVVLGGAKLEVPIEPVGVIVLGIDGLRQDVLYPAELDAVQDGGKYRVDIGSLSGLKQVLAGYDQPTEKKTYVMLPKVTAIFPSVTLASWASIFTGRMPGPANDVVDAQGNVTISRGTGILGNEFFARDIAFGVPHEKTINNPRGLITFDSGASQGYDAFSKPQGLYYKEFFIPYQFSWDNVIAPVFRFDSNDPADPGRSPQNDPRLLVPQTVFENIGEMPGVKKYFDSKGGNPVVVSYSHYSRGAYWVTWDTPFPWGESNTMDKASTNKFIDYLQRNYATIPYTTWLRNKTPFSALTVWYLPGLDHQAHIKGMDTYKSYFQNTTDGYIKSVVSTLKGLDEFDNKIFIIVADHGTTAMPMQIANPDNGQLVDSYATCNINLNMKSEKKQAMEKNLNNNLHIWELSEVMRTIGERGWANYKVLAPAQISALFKDKSGTELSYGATADINKANVVAALNGPMAHIYLRGITGWQDKNVDILKLSSLAGFLKVVLMQSGAALNETEKGRFNNLLSSIDVILVRDGGVYKIFKGVISDAAGNITGPDVQIIDANVFNSGKYVTAMKRIEGMNNVDRSGDIVLVMKDDTADSANNRYTTGVACKSWHGSLSPSDSYVPFVVSYPGGNKYEIKPFIENVQGCNLTQGCEGNWKVADVIKEIIKTQYIVQ